MKIGTKAPDFSLLDSNEDKVKLNSFKGSWVVLYFYPKDNTPGCTIEAIDFSSLLKDFEKLDCLVFGISPDSTKSHQSFTKKKNLKVTLLSDPEKKVLKEYGAWGIKKLYGQEFEGVKRTTYLINPKGFIAHIWNNVKAKGHAEAVKEKLRELKKNP